MAVPRVAVVGAGAWGTTLARLLAGEVIADAGGLLSARIAALSGPTLAVEIARGLPASAVVAASDPDVAGRVAASDPDVAGRVVARLNRREFRFYVNRDILGEELCGALKNIVAIAVVRGRRSRRPCRERPKAHIPWRPP